MGERAKATDGYRADSSPLLGKKRGERRRYLEERDRGREGEEKGGGRTGREEKALLFFLKLRT